MKRILIILAVILLIGAGALAYFFLFYSKPATVTVSPTGNTGFPTAGNSGQLPADPSGTTSTTTQTPPIQPSTVAPRLVQVSKGPVVLGEVIVNKKGNASSSPETIVSYIERQSGNVYTYNTTSKTITRTSNRTIPGIQSASWLPDASVAFVRYLSGQDFSTVNTYALPADGSSGFLMPQNLSDIAVSSTSVLALSSGVNGSTASLTRTDGTKATAVFTTPLSSLRVSFAGKSQYLITTKASATLPGSTFLVDGTGRLSRVAGPLEGLVALASPSGKWVLISYSSGTSLQMKLVNVATNENISLPVATIVDKCVWTNDDRSIYCGTPLEPSQTFSYPDDWYQGAAHFSDRIWRIQVEGRYAQLVLDFPKETKDSLDAVALAVDPNDTTLVFVNKNDGSLWSYSL